MTKITNIPATTTRKSSPRQFYACAAGELIKRGISFEFIDSPSGGYLTLKKYGFTLSPDNNTPAVKGRMWVEQGDNWTSFDDLDSFEVAFIAMLDWM